MEAMLEITENYELKRKNISPKVAILALEMEKILSESESMGRGKRDINPYAAPEMKEKTILRLFKLECKHQKEYENGERVSPFKWQDCKDCICAFIPYLVGDNILRDVCFAVWHSEINRPK